MLEDPTYKHQKGLGHARREANLDEQGIERILRRGLSDNPNAFRDELLERCLDVLCTLEEVPLEDAELDMLAAAGDPSQIVQDPLDSNPS